jgi:hypothetical protein
MLYLTPFNTSGVSNSSFAARGLSKHKPGPISSIHILTIPQVRQIAYDGYEKNIDAFLAATALQKHLNCTNETFDVELSKLDITFPLSIPRVVVSFPKLPANTLTKILEKIEEKSSYEKIQGIAKHPAAYIIHRPTWSMVRQLAPHCQKEIPQIDGSVKVHNAVEMFKVYALIELYLRTNTYPAFKDKRGGKAHVNASTSYPLKRPCDIKDEHLSKKTTYTTVSMTHNDGTKESGLWFGKIADKEVMFTEEAFNINNAVFSAKPSPLTSSTASWSTPSNAPSMPGLPFEYFEGMNTGDASFLKTTISRFGLRVLGKENYQSLRGAVAGFASSKEGQVLAHILMGMTISLEGQGQLHLLFDGQKYVGFVVYGERWQIQVGGTWYIPMRTIDLRNELGKIKTHQSSLAEVELLLRSKGVIPCADMDAVKLAGFLAEVKWSEDKEIRRGEQKKFEDLVGRLEFGKNAVEVGHKSLIEAIRSIVEEDIDLSGNFVHFPMAEDYHYFKKRSAIVLAQFGYKVPSFSIFKDETSFVVKDILGGESDAAKARRKGIPAILIALKPLKYAVPDFDKFRKAPKICSKSKERASDYRHLQFGGDFKDYIVKSLGDLIEKIKATIDADAELGDEDDEDMEREEDKVVVNPDDFDFD